MSAILLPAWQHTLEDKLMRMLESFAATSAGAGDDSTNSSIGSLSMFFPHTVRLKTN